MKHFGDITKLSGYTLTPVDCITGGSPCQDLSVAGKRAGLGGERSGLFMEQVRIVKEMRERDRRDGRPDHLCRPRYMVWENVPGAFSSNGGKDFQAVLTEIVRIAEPETPDVPLPEKGKWTHSGCLMGESKSGQPFSVVWRLHDAKYWGVPQRRKRVCVCADFNGLTAGEILFSPELRRETEGTDADQTVRHSGEECGQPVRTLPEGLPGDSEPGKEEREGTAGAVRGGVESAIGAITIDSKQQSMVTQEDLAATIGANAYKEPQSVFCLQGNGINRSDGAGCGGRGWREDVSYTLNTVDLPAVFDGSRRHAYQPFGNVCETVQAHYGTDGGNQPIVVGLKREKNTRTAVFDARGNGNGETAPTLTGDHQNRVTDYTAIACQKLVRRLTPLECERLQGYPDGWTDIGEWTDSKGKKHKEADSPRYKALGNSIALPFWFWLLRRISAQYERPATLGSLFDGIGGFPLCWERCNGKGTAIWASEIEEFPIAVTKLRFPDKEEP